MSTSGPKSVSALARMFQTGQANNAIGSLSVDTAADRALAEQAHQRQLAATGPSAQAQQMEDNFVSIYNTQLELLGDVDKALAATEKLMSQQQDVAKPQPAITRQFDEDKYAAALQGYLSEGNDFEIALDRANRQFGLNY